LNPIQKNSKVNSKSVPKPPKSRSPATSIENLKLANETIQPKMTRKRKASQNQEMFQLQIQIQNQNQNQPGIGDSGE